MSDTSDATAAKPISALLANIGFFGTTRTV
jgi:hypothetical protein